MQANAETTAPLATEQSAGADEFRIEYTITRQRPGEANFAEIGFGSSGTWSDVDSALYTVQSDVQNRQWETTDGMPDPAEV